MTDMVNHPPHYSAHPSGIECIEITRDMTFDAGNAVKYVYRADHKNGRQDIEKARWYLRDAIEHGDVIHVGRNVQDWESRVSKVLRAEAELYRVEFFRAILRRDLCCALLNVDRMLAVSV